jgi:hypothetical protein
MFDSTVPRSRLALDRFSSKAQRKWVDAPCHMARRGRQTESTSPPVA